MNEQRIPVNQENSELNIPIHSEGTSANVELTRETSVIRGVDGISPVAYVEQTSTGATITVTDAEGTTTANILNGERGEQGPRGLQGERGETGATGADGSAATVAVGTTTTGQPGTNASVTNSGTSSAAVLNFTIPRGERGETGAAGTNGTNGQDGYSPTATVVKNDHIAVITITDKNGTTTASVSDGSDATVTVDSALSSTSENPVQNKAINSALGSKANSSDIPTKTSDLQNDSGYITDAGVTSFNGSTGAVTYTAPVTSVNGSTGAVTVTVPTKTSDLNNDSGFITSSSLPTKTSDLVNDGSDNTSTYLEADETAYRTKAIPYGACDGTSTSTAFTATVPGITELRDGVCMWLKNGVVTSASGFTININSLGAKPVYSNMAAASAETTLFNVNYTMMFVYDSTRVTGGCWMLNRGYYTDANSIGYQLRTNSTALTTADRTRYYRLLFTSANNTQWVPANTQYDNSATSNKTVNQRKINPFGRIVYMTGTTNIPAGSTVGATTTWDQYTLNLGYSFAKGSALTMTYPKPVYVKAAPQTDGSAIIDSTTPYVQDLPTTADGKIYIFLGIAYSATNIELQINHPVYEFKGGMIRPYTNSVEPPTITLSTTDIGEGASLAENTLYGVYE